MGSRWRNIIVEEKMLDKIKSKIKKIQSGNYVITKRFEKLTFNPIMDKEAIQQFEYVNNIVLPEDYKEFIQIIGNGGAGPGLGILPLNDNESILDPRILSEEGKDKILLSENFPYCNAWNDESFHDALETNADNLDVLRGNYFSTEHISGSICFCNLGCGELFLLVVTGAEAGNVWYDGRGNYGGIFPYSYKEKERVSFLEWYDIWLTEILDEIPIVERDF